MTAAALITVPAQLYANLPPKTMTPTWCGARTEQTVHVLSHRNTRVVAHSGLSRWVHGFRVWSLRRTAMKHRDPDKPHVRLRHFGSPAAGSSSPSRQSPLPPPPPPASGHRSSGCRSCAPASAARWPQSRPACGGRPPLRWLRSRLAPCPGISAPPHLPVCAAPGCTKHADTSLHAGPRSVQVLQAVGAVFCEGCSSPDVGQGAHRPDSV